MAIRFQSTSSTKSDLAGADQVRALLVVYGFAPLHHSGTIRSEAFAHYLPEWGIRTTVLTDEVPKELDSSRRMGIDAMRAATWSDADQPYRICRFAWRHRPQRTALAALANRFPLGTTVVKSLERSAFLRRAVEEANRLVSFEDIDVVYGSAAPAEAVLLASELAREHQKPCVLDLRDPWSYQPPLPYRHHIDFLLERRLEAKTLKSAAEVVVTTEATADLIINKLDVPRDRVQVIPNGYDERDFVEHGDVQPPRDTFVVTHAGQLTLDKQTRTTFASPAKSWLGLDVFPLRTDTRTRSPAYLLAAAAEFLKDHPAAREHLRIQLIGLSGAETCAAISNFPFPDCLTVVDRVSPQEAVSACLRSHLLVLMQNRYYLDGRESCVAIPAKLYTYLRTGRRILACVPDSEMANIVRSTNAGVCVEPDHVGQIRDVLRTEYENWIEAPADFAPRLLPEFDRRQTAQKLAEVFRHVSSTGAGSTAPAVHSEA